MKSFACRLVVATLAVMSLHATQAAIAQENWPARTITFVVPFPPGGTTDLMARGVAQEVSKTLRQPVVVENRGGANGAIGSAAVAAAVPDGYTFLVSGIGSNAINHGLYDKLRYDSNKDYVHVSQLISGPNVLIANTEAPFKTLHELLAYAKNNPGKLSYASSGNGASGHLAMELLKQSVSIDMQHVPYKGGAPALQDVVGGQVPLMFINQDVPSPHVKSGKLRVIAVADTKRNPLYPDRPTLHELGLTDFSAVSWVGLSAPRGTPAPIIDRMHGEVVKALNTPALKTKLEEQGFRVVASTPQQFTDFVRSETDRWTKVIKKANIRME